MPCCARSGDRQRTICRHPRDDLIDGSPAVMKQMVDQYDYYQCSVLGVQQVAPEDTASYGIAMPPRWPSAYRG